MKTDKPLSEYLQDVDRALAGVPTSERRRLLEEVEGHLRDAIDDRLERGLPRTEATRQAIADFGPAADIAAEYLPADDVEPSRGHWVPIALPAALTALCVVGLAWSATQLPDGTLGSQHAFRTYLRLTLTFGGIGLAGWMWLRRHPAARAINPAWVASIAAILVLVL